MLPAIVMDNLHNPHAWHGIAIRHEFPNVDRLWMAADNGDKLCLHKLHQFSTDDTPYYHKHPWACETEILQGSYEMGVGYGPGPELPPVACLLTLTVGATYVMDDPNSWHFIRPLDGPVYTSFKITTRWASQPDNRRNKRLTAAEIKALLKEFARVLRVRRSIASRLRSIMPY